MNNDANWNKGARRSLLFLFVGGLCMAFGTGNAWWLLLTAGVLIVFYAG